MKNNIRTEATRGRYDSDCAVDLEHLKRYTSGNRGLERELLALFRASAELTLAALTVDASEKTWREQTHALKGSARAIGAWDIAAAAEQAEQVAPDNTASRRLTIRRLESLVADAKRFIDAETRRIEEDEE